MTKTIVKKIGYSIFILFTLIIITFLTLNMLSFIKKEPIKLFGYRYSVVVTNSMEKTIPVGSYIFYKEIDDYQVHDVIVFKSKYGKRLIVHEIINITEQGFETKGNNNQLSDQDPSNLHKEDYITTDNILGKVTYSTTLFGIGKLFVTQQSTILLIVIAVTFILFISYLISFIKELKLRQEEKILEQLKNEIKEEQEEEKTK